MSNNKDNEIWAANIAFTGSKEKVKQILDMVEEMNDNEDIQNYTGIEGPYDSLSLMLKRREENFQLGFANKDEDED